MFATVDSAEYLDEIRQEVCGRCTERPHGGPPCTPLGKVCGVELHLPELIASVRGIHSDRIAPYLINNRQLICAHCEHLGRECCPCPMDSLAVLVVEAIETVDERRRQRQRGSILLASLPGKDRPEMEPVCRAYEAAAGRWAGCDWPTVFGVEGLDLNGYPAREAETLAVEYAGEKEAATWEAAARWLQEVEKQAEQAETAGAKAVAAASAGRWDEAVEHARRAWGLELATLRPLRRFAATWQPFCKAVEEAARR